jgi:hypothetical protein
VSRPLFSLGQILATPGCLEALEKTGENLKPYLDRHVKGDWGVVCAEDAEANINSLKDGSRLLSAYTLKSGVKIWIITETVGDNGNRAATTALLPSEY